MSFPHASRLMFTAQHGNVEAARRLCESKDPMFGWADLDTALRVAKEFEQDKVFTMLAHEFGAKLRAKNKSTQDLVSAARHCPRAPLQQ